jgi:hypothetical protein
VKLNKFIVATIATIVLGSLTVAANASPAFVGSYAVDGAGVAPAWPTNPICYTPQEAAALLFGGLPSDYLISVNSSMDPTTITDTGHEDGWGEPDTIFAQNFKLQTGTGYNDPGGAGSAWSAYVFDHSDTNINYVWLNDKRTAPVCDGAMTPEPAGIALFSLGTLPLLGLLRRRIA